MQNLPKVVIKRLQSPPSESHPDADLLTAFAEQSLTGVERDHVVEHLARCGDCREVVSLALPPQLEIQPLTGSNVNWFRWTLLRGSAFRWAAVAAGIVVIASIGTLQYRRQPGREVAFDLFQARQAIATSPQTSQSASQVAVPQAGMKDEKLAAARAQTDLAENKSASSESAIARPRANSAVAMHRDDFGAGTASGASRGSNSFHGAAVAVTTQNPASAAPASQNPAPAPAFQTVVVSGAMQAVEAQSTTVEVAAQPAPQSQLIQSETAEQAADRVGKAKPASPQASAAMAPPSLHSEPLLMKSLAVPRWTISASGALQRSLDGGQTWLDVNIAANASVASDLALRAKKETASEETEARSAVTSEAPAGAASAAPSAASADARYVRKQSAAAAPLILLALSVSSNAAEVWAGGSGGALYHTTDAGNHWARVLPSSAGIILTGDILSIQFSDAKNGTVTTSTPEVWTTLDAGQTWHKQP